MFQDIAPHTYTNDFAWLTPEPSDRALVYAGDKVLVKVDRAAGAEAEAAAASGAATRAPAVGGEAGTPAAGIIDFPRISEVAPDGLPEHTDDVAGIVTPQGHSSIYLFTVGLTAFFFVNVSQDRIAQLLASGYEYLPTNELKEYAPKELVFAGITGLEYHSWYSTRRFCGKCGGSLEHDLVERMMRCPECGVMEFPKVVPAVIVAVVNPENGKVLVSRYAGREYTRYALIAGFAEMGETIEQTVHREVAEEVGLRVKNLRYYKSQPWPFSSSLLMGFFCELDGSDRITLDTHELEFATWLDPSELPTDDADYSLTRDMMSALRRGEVQL